MALMSLYQFSLSHQTSSLGRFTTIFVPGTSSSVPVNPTKASRHAPEGQGTSQGKEHARASKYPNTPANTAKIQLGQEPAKYTRISPNTPENRKDASIHSSAHLLFRKTQYSSGFIERGTAAFENWTPPPPRGGAKAPKARQSKRKKIDAATAEKLQLKLKAATEGQSVELLKRYGQSGDGNLDAKELKQLIRDDLKVPASVVSNAEIETLVAALHRQTLGAISAALDEVGDLADRELAAAVVVERGDERLDLAVRDRAHGHLEVVVRRLLLSCSATRSGCATSFLTLRSLRMSCMSSFASRLPSPDVS